MQPIKFDLNSIYKSINRIELIKFVSAVRLEKGRTCEGKGAVGSADLKISKSALRSFNHHNFSNTKPIYTE